MKNKAEYSKYECPEGYDADDLKQGDQVVVKKTLVVKNRLTNKEVSFLAYLPGAVLNVQDVKSETVLIGTYISVPKKNFFDCTQLKEN